MYTKNIFISLLALFLSIYSVEKVLPLNEVIRQQGNFNFSDTGYGDIEGTYSDYTDNDFEGIGLAVFDNTNGWPKHNGFFSHLVSAVSLNVPVIVLTSLSVVLLVIILLERHRNHKPKEYNHQQEHQRVIESFFLFEHNVRHIIKNMKPLFLNIQITDLSYVNVQFQKFISDLEDSLDKYKVLNLLDKDSMAMEPINPHGLIEEIISGLEYKEHIQLVGSKTCSILADELFFKHVFLNLIENAYKFKKPLHSLSIHIVIKKNNDLCTIELIDNGIGFSPTMTDDVFAKGTIAHSYAQGSSSGLGLYFVNRVISLFGGTIEVISEPHTYTKFIINLPIQ